MKVKVQRWSETRSPTLPSREPFLLREGFPFFFFFLVCARPLLVPCMVICKSGGEREIQREKRENEG